MKGFVLILLMIYPWLVNAQSLHYATSYDSAFIQAKEEGKMVLVYAYSPCRLCDDMTEKVLSLPDMADFLNNISFWLIWIWTNGRVFSLKESTG